MAADKRRSVLIVEDERIVAKDLQQTLMAMGYDAFAIVSSADEALKRAAERRPDVVLMDIRIKGSCDGIDTATALRARHGVPIIFLTAHADEATIERAKQSDPYGYLMKPVKAAELRSAIEVCIHRSEMENVLRDRERWFSTTLRSIVDAVVAVDAAGKVNFMNPAAEVLTAIRAADAIGRPVWDDVLRDWGMFRPDGSTRVPGEEIPIARALAGETVEQVELFVRAPGQPEGRWHSANAAPVRDPDGSIRGAVTVSRDITALRNAVEQLTKAAVRDELTGLLNRRGFLEQATREVLLANRHKRPLALIYVDLDGMKEINDRLGHAAGDRALADTADLLRVTFRLSDLIARLGGDEFAVLAPNYGQGDEGATVRSRFAKNLASFHREHERPFKLSASMGITIYDPSNQHRTIEELLADADARMYATKQPRRSGMMPAPR